MQLNHPNEYYALQTESGTIIILGRGLAQHWRRNLESSFPCRSFRGELTDLNELSHIINARIDNLRAILWETSAEPARLADSLKKIPREIPILLRYPLSLDPEKNHRLFKLLKQREPLIKRSFPLRFRPPFCRLWEVISSNAAGPTSKIEISLANDNTFEKHKTDQQVFAFFDLMDLCACLMNESITSQKPKEIEPQNLYTIEFPGQRKIIIRKETKKTSAISGIIEIKVLCRLAEIKLIFNHSIQQWQLERSFTRRINPKPLPLLYPPDHDPVELELIWFLRDKNN